MRALVTGGAGFIGSHLVDLLVASGHSVVVLDSFVSGRQANIEQAAASGQLTVCHADIVDREAIAPAFADIDWVFHLAGIGDIVPSVENPTAYYATNVTGTLNVLECARAVGVKRFIYAASSSSYGIPDTYPTPETAPIAPRYPYALTKHLGEELVLHWSDLYRLPALSLRLFNVFGPRSRTTGAYGAVFGVFLAQKLAGKPFTVVGDGSQTRDFTYVSDVAEAFLAAAQASNSGLALNVGSGGHYSVNMLVDLLGGPVVHIPKRPGEPDCTFADTTLISNILAWQPKVSFEEGVHRILERIDDWRNAPLWEPKSIQGATTAWFKYLG